MPAIEGVRRGHLYVFLREDGIRKVGVSVELRQRQLILQRQYQQKMELEMSWVMSERAIGLVEQFVHQKLRPLRFNEHCQRELYDLPLRQIVAVVREGRAWARQWLPYGDLNRGWATDADVLAVKHLGTARAAKRIGMTPGGYIKRLQAAEKRAQEALVKPQQEHADG